MSVNSKPAEMQACVRCTCQRYVTDLRDGVCIATQLCDALKASVEADAQRKADAEKFK